MKVQIDLVDNRVRRKRREVKLNQRAAESLFGEANNVGSDTLGCLSLAFEDGGVLDRMEHLLKARSAAQGGQEE